jgi:mannose-1-phosphate guanylyltransferase/mannose-6-phosphate isomerase
VTGETQPPVLVVMAGGTGKRFWPASRRTRPKQALSLFTGQALLEDTLARLRPLTLPERLLVNTSRELRPLLEGVCGPVGWIEEPFGMDTAACAGLSAAWAEHLAPGCIVALLPADHFIPDAGEFRSALAAALEHAESGDIVTLGIQPTRPDPGYGYIELGEPLGPDAYRAAAFREKPSPAVAEQYLREGRHLWNAGMFVARASVLLDAFRAHAPAIAEALERMRSAGFDPAVVEREYARVPRISFDHAVMEKVSGVRVLRARFAWDDVGSWLSLGRIFPAAAHGNVSAGRHVGLETHECIVVSDDPAGLVATAGVRGLVVVQSGKAVLVASKPGLGLLKDLVERLEAEGHDAWL